MQRQQSSFPGETVRTCRSLTPGRGHGDRDIAQVTLHLAPSIVVRSAGTIRSSMVLGLWVDIVSCPAREGPREAENIGRLIPAAVVTVEFPHTAITDEAEAEATRSRCDIIDQRRQPAAQADQVETGVATRILQNDLAAVGLRRLGFRTGRFAWQFGVGYDALRSGSTTALEPVPVRVRVAAVLVVERLRRGWLKSKPG